MITFNAPTYNPIGNIRFSQEPEGLYQAQRRTAITATLDGGVAVADTGYSVADRTIQVRVARATLTQIGAIDYLIQLYPQLVVSTRSGCFLALVEYTTRQRELTISMRFLAELS